MAFTATARPAEPKPMRWTRAAYHAAHTAGVFTGGGSCAVSPSPSPPQSMTATSATAAAASRAARKPIQTLYTLGGSNRSVLDVGGRDR